MLYRSFSTQAEIDDHYDVEKSIPNIKEIITTISTQSEKARSELDHKLSVPFGPTIAEHVDIFPTKQPKAPILVFIHGGYWRQLSSKNFSHVAFGPVSAGVTVVLTNYELCPKVTMDEIVRQSRAAVAWVYKNATTFGGDPERIYISGHSAGGHLTAMVMSTEWERDYGLPKTIIKGGCAISGLYDLMPFPYSWIQPSLQLTWDQVLRNSPILHVPKEAPPLIVTCGGDEPVEFIRQSQDFLSAWKAGGLVGEFLPLPGYNHFNIIEGFLKVDSILCSKILHMMQVK